VQSYRLGPNDRVTISVYGEDDLSREYIVSPGGTVSLPLIGDVVAQGRTADDLRDEIQHRLADGYLNNPTVTVMISGFRNFYILGEVNKPGEYPYESGLTVMQAVAEAAGYTYRAAKRYAFIKHEGETKETRIQISPDMLVRPGDTIRLGERYF
jgi:polysaccharide export outer membrane protein